MNQKLTYTQTDFEVCATNEPCGFSTGTLKGEPAGVIVAPGAALEPYPGVPLPFETAYLIRDWARKHPADYDCF